MEARVTSSMPREVSNRQMSYAEMKNRSSRVHAIHVEHGGKVYEAARRWGVEPHEVLDFSANINPLGPPQTVLSAIENALTPTSLRVYPDAHAFLNTIVNKHLLMPDEIVVGSGAASLIFAVIHALSPKRVLILEPGFVEYSRASAAVNAQITTALLTEERGFTPDFARLVRNIKERQFDLVILNSPHNPTGALYPRDGLLSLIDAAEEHNTAVLLDEAFIDYASQESLVSLAPTKSHKVLCDPRDSHRLYGKQCEIGRKDQRPNRPMVGLNSCARSWMRCLGRS
jgi:threonine-phosphate decarboxylase